MNLLDKPGKYGGHSAAAKILAGWERDRPAEPAAAALRDHILRLPEQLSQSLIWDQGKEMARHALSTIDTGVAVYFCDPNSPWQRGSNENTNGRSRLAAVSRTQSLSAAGV